MIKELHGTLEACDKAEIVLLLLPELKAEIEAVTEEGDVVADEGDEMVDEGKEGADWASRLR